MARECLITLRKIIRDEVPEADECISYGIPTYKLHGMIASFAAFKNHCSFFPGQTLDEFREQLGEHKTSRGTVQFTPEKPIPEALIRAMLRSRVNENLAKPKRR